VNGHRIAVKVCGITRLEDALCAVEAGADLIGFIFAPSPRRIDAESAARIIAALPSGVERVGVFVDESAERIREIARIAGLTMVQLHGKEPPEMDHTLGIPVLRAVRVSGTDAAAALPAARAFPSPRLLIEPAVAGKAGGSGTAMEWALARAVVAGLPEKRVFLAGGLGPHNVREAIEAVRPFGVDASSRLEQGPGRKSADLVRRFVEAVRSVE
jgi:phosphoribosylanthranilate isomerase